MNRLFIIVSLLVLASCKTVPVQDCSTWKPYISVAGTVVASTLSCSNPAAVQSDLYAYYEAHANCSQVPLTTSRTVGGGPIALMVCPVAVEFVQSFSASKLPATWGCTLATPAVFTLKACESIPY